MLFKIFKVFFTLGFFSFGGGYSMIPLIEREIVEKHKILKKEEFIEIISIASGLPGAIALNISIFIGNLVGGVKGAIVGAIASILPCLIIISSIMLLFSSVIDNIYTKKILLGMSGVVVAFILYATYKISVTAYKNKKYFIITVIAFIVSTFLKNIPIPLTIILAIVIGILTQQINVFIKKYKGEKNDN